MAEQVAFGIELQDHASGAAASLSSKLEALKDIIAHDTAELRQMQAAMRQMRAGGLQATDTFVELKKAVDAKRIRVASASEAYARLGGSFERTNEEEHEGVLASILGAEAIEKVGEVALEGAKKIAEMGAELVEFAIDAADAKRALGLQLDALLGNSEAAGELIEHIENLASTGLVTTATATSLARGLAIAGLSGERLTETFENLGAVAATMGEDSADALMTLVERTQAADKLQLPLRSLARAGLSVTDVLQQIATQTGKSLEVVRAEFKSGKISADEGIDAINAALGAKGLGKNLEKASRGFGAQLRGLKVNVERLFSDIDIEPLLDSMRDFTQLFDQSTSSGQALKQIVELIFDTIFGGTKDAGPALKDVFREGIIWAQEIIIWVMELRNTLRRLAKESGIGDWVIDWRLLAEAVGIVALGVAILAGIIGALVGAMAIATVMIFGFIGAIGYLLIKLGGLYVDFMAAGANFVAGLVQGIIGGTGSVVNAVVNLGRSAINAVKNTLGIHSPSSVFAELGKNMAMGAVVGMGRATPDVQSAAVSMLAPPEHPGRSGAGATSIGPVSVTIDANGSGGDMTAIEEAARRGVYDALEQAAAMLAA